MDRFDREQFSRYLRDGLNHLQDPGFLRHSPLVAIFNILPRYDTPTELQRILIAAVEDFEPQPDEPADSRQWRMYESLFYRYVERYPQEDVAKQLGLSIRQVRREQKSALEAVSLKLWEQFDIETRLDNSSEKQEDLFESPVNPIEAELSWLINGNSVNAADLNQMLPDVLHLIEPLAAKHQVTIENQIAFISETLEIDPVALRQILINLLGIAITRTPIDGRLILDCVETASAIQIILKPSPSGFTTSHLSGDEQSRFDMAQYLLDLFGGKLKSFLDGGGFTIVIMLPRLEQIPVMVVDDNVTTLQLFQRYVTATRYHLVAVHNPSEALHIAEKSTPKIIVLDVMMPRIDGWELLSRLQTGGHTHHIPVIVCSIMPQEELALSLGAASFIQKPVTRETFLAGLDQLMNQIDSEFH